MKHEFGELVVMKYKLMVVVERPDGSLFKQCVSHLTPEEANNEETIRHLIRHYIGMLGSDYYVVDRYLDY